jgi:type I restriction enzyme M protein
MLCSPWMSAECGIKLSILLLILNLWAKPPPGEGGGEGEGYADIPGFCKSATLEDLRKHGHVLTPGRYVGAAAQEGDGEPFEEKVQRLVAQLREQQAQGRRLDEAIWKNLKELGYDA